MFDGSNGLHLLIQAFDRKFAAINHPGLSSGPGVVVLCCPTAVVV